MTAAAQMRIYPKSEADEQARVIDYCLWKGDPYDKVIVSMSGNICFYNNFALINKLTRVGAIGTSARPQLKGRPDLIWLVPRKGYHFLVIELKLNKQARITTEEKAYLEFCREQGGHAVRCDGADEAIAVIDWYMQD